MGVKLRGDTERTERAEIMDGSVDTSSSQMDHDIRHVYCSPTTNEKDRARRLLFLATKRHRSTTHARRHIICFSMGKVLNYDK